MDSVEFIYLLTHVCMGVGKDLILENANIEFNIVKPKIITPNILNIPELANVIVDELPLATDVLSETSEQEPVRGGAELPGPAQEHPDLRRLLPHVRVIRAIYVPQPPAAPGP